MFNPLPRSIWFFVFTGVVFLLQTSPIPGFWLLLLGAPFWSVLTINVGFLTLGIEAVAGRVHRVWLIAPMLWFAGYEYVAWQSHRALEQLETNISAFNRDKRVAFDQNKQSLIIGDTALYGTSTALLEGYDLHVVYLTNRGSKPTTYTAQRVSRTESCESINEARRFQTLGPLEVRSSSFLPSYLPNSCIYNAPEAPNNSSSVIYSIGAKESRTIGHLEYKLFSVELRTDGARVNLQSASATPYRWFPTPVMGCMLNSGNPSWDCATTFLKESSVWVPSTPADIAAKALDLKAIAKVTPTDVEQRQTEVDQASLDAFNQFLADASRPITSADLRNVARHPDQYGAEASQIVTTIGKVLAEPLPHLDIAANLGEMLAMLPDTKLREVSPQLLKIYAAAPQISMNVIWDKMATQLSSLGEPALVVLERLAFDQKEPFTRPIYALCRVGSPASHDGERIADLLRGSQRSDDLHIAAYKTLLRIGRGDLLASESDAQSQYRSDNYKFWRQTINPNSSPAVCTD